MAKVLIGSINHDGRMDAEGAAALYVFPTDGRHTCIAMPKSSSLLTLNCNIVWAEALNRRVADGIEWFALFHSDIRPAANWVDTLIEEAEKHGAHMVSAVSPIKDSRGLSSIAVFDCRNPWKARYRLTLKQIHNQLPETFGLSECVAALTAGPDGDKFRADAHLDTLDVNTACCVVRLDRDWADRGNVWFENRDRLVLRDEKWVADVQSEDWVFSRKISNAGGKVMATRRVRILHQGLGAWRSDEAWGRDYDEDLLGKPTEETKPEAKELEPCPTS